MTAAIPVDLQLALATFTPQSIDPAEVIAFSR
jgi:hypothetical protein